MRAQICFFVSIAFSFAAWGAVTGSLILPELRRRGRNEAHSAVRPQEAVFGVEVAATSRSIRPGRSDTRGILRVHCPRPAMPEQLLGRQPDQPTQALVRVNVGAVGVTDEHAHRRVLGQSVKQAFVRSDRVQNGCVLQTAPIGKSGCRGNQRRPTPAAFGRVGVQLSSPFWSCRRICCSPRGAAKR